jgi:hypothetical protein
MPDPVQSDGWTDGQKSQERFSLGRTQSEEEEEEEEEEEAGGVMRHCHIFQSREITPSRLAR